MLIIDKQQEGTKWAIVHETIEDGQLVIHSSYDKKTFQFPLPTSSSEYPNRYKEYTFDTTDFAELIAGVYIYTISDGTREIKKGMVMVVDAGQQTVEDRYVSITPAEEADDFVVYNPEQ
jgi:hypothetical protein